MYVFSSSVAALFSVLPTNVFAAFGLFKTEESWPCGCVPRFSKFHNTEADRETVLRRKELCFSWLRAHEEKEECFSTADSTGAKYGNRSYRRSFQEMGLQHPTIPRMESRV